MRKAAETQSPVLFNALRRSGVRALIVSFFLAIQSFLVLHQLEHGFRQDLTADSDGCAVCQVAANLLPTPEPIAVIAPHGVAYERPIPVSEISSAQRWLTAGFRSRAPPISPV